MIKKLLLIILSSLFIGCSTTNIVKMNANGEDIEPYKWDHWDYFVDALKSGRMKFSWDKAIVVYLVSGIKIYDGRPDITDPDWNRHFGIIITIFRVSW